MAESLLRFNAICFEYIENDNLSKRYTLMENSNSWVSFCNAAVASMESENKLSFISYGISM